MTVEIDLILSTFNGMDSPYRTVLTLLTIWFTYTANNTILSLHLNTLLAKNTITELLYIEEVIM